MNAHREGPIRTAKDRSLADRARHGDLDAFEELMHPRLDAIYRLSFAIVGDEADARDSTQDVLDFSGSIDAATIEVFRNP